MEFENETGLARALLRGTRRPVFGKGQGRVEKITMFDAIRKALSGV